MPIRIHELLLGFAGRLDDDALADARQMLASAELDRSLEFVAGCVVAGRVVLAKAQHRDLESLFADTYLDPAVIDRVEVRDPAPVARHRFAVGAVDGREPDRGVADAVRPVLDVLPDVRSVWCVWRLTPAGPVSGPVPHRVVLVGVGPGGFAPATAYRVEYALRRAGIRASVEVLVDGNQPTDYHQEAMRCARQVPFDEPDSGDRPRMSPVEPVRAQPFAGDQRFDRPAEPPRSFAEPAPAGPSRPEPMAAPHDAQRALPPPIELPQAAEPAQHELPPTVPLHRGEPDGAMPTPPQGSLPPPVELRPPDAGPVAGPAGGPLPPPVELRRGPAGGPLPPPVELHRPDAAPADGPLSPPVELHRADAGPRGDHPLPPPVELPRAEPAGSAIPVPQPAPEPAEATSAFAQERLPAERSLRSEPSNTEPGEPDEPDDQPPSALRMETPTNSRPAPRRRSKPKDATRPRLLPASKDNHSAAFGDDVLNTQERSLLRELQDELARREQQDKGSTSSSAWSGRHGKPGFDSARASGAPTMINGVPPHPDGRA